MPSTVGTTTENNATMYPSQRKCFFANGRFWVFYSDGVNMVYCTSTNGVTWTAPANVRACTAGHLFSIWFDGIYLHYAYCTSAVTNRIYYRRGTPDAIGTITWSADEQAVSTTFNKQNYPFVSVDSLGYVWIEYFENNGAGSQYPYVIKSGNNNGTWGVTPGGFPYQLSATSDISWGGFAILPLLGGKMLAIYVRMNNVIYSQRWTGAAWGAETTTPSEIGTDYYFSACAQDDDVHLVHLKRTTNDIQYVKYTYAADAWGGEVTVQAAASAPVLSIDRATNILYCFWAGSPTANHIFYKKYVGGAWNALTDWITEAVLAGNFRLTCLYRDYGQYTGLVYVTLAASPYNVRFEYLSLGGSSLKVSLLRIQTRGLAP